MCFNKDISRLNIYLFTSIFQIKHILFLFLQYDWGGPLVYKNKLIGIFAGSIGCASTTYPPVYTDVTQFKNWISKTIKDNSDFNEEIDLSQLV